MAENFEHADDVKKRRMNEDICAGDHNPDEKTEFSGFRVCKVLSDNSRSKCLFVHGKLSEEDAVVLMEKTPFDASKVEKIICDQTQFKETLKNDIYSTYEATTLPEFSAIKVTLIHPATQKHISKYTDQEVYAIEETELLYKTVTLPYIEEQKFSIQWVYNILEKKTESDRIVFEDEDKDHGFILLPDMKWNRKDINSLYLVAIAHTHDIKSLRDLSQKHLPLLRNILTKGKGVIKENFGVESSKLHIYVHYQPSYYHFHVHFTHLKLDSPGYEADRAHNLSSVISNIEQEPHFYQNATLVFKVRANDGLYSQYESQGYFTSL